MRGFMRSPWAREAATMRMARFLVRPAARWLLVVGLLFSEAGLAQVFGVAPGIPEPEYRNVIVQLFNWRFDDIRREIPRLRKLGYSHIHVSPPQKSNEQIREWWGRYQPVDFTRIEGPLGNEAEFRAMTTAAAENGIQILVDVVLNHTVDINEAPPGLVQLNGNRVVAEGFPQFEPEDFHDRCEAGDEGDTVQRCWLLNTLLDLRTESSHVRQVAKDYLRKLARLGAAGYRFDAARHIESDFYAEVLSAVPGRYAFGEIIRDHQRDFDPYLRVEEMDFYDFLLLSTMREAFSSGGDLRILKDPRDHGRALDGPRAVTFVRNHDIDRGQNNDHGLTDPGGRSKYGVGWDEGQGRLVARANVALAHAYVLGREDGLPYVFADMNTLNPADQDDRFDDPLIVAAIRFHNLCLAGTGGVSRRSDIWQIKTHDAIGWQRGNDRFVVINKAAAPFRIVEQHTTLQEGEYKEVSTGLSMRVEPGGTIQRWSVRPRIAVMFVRVGS
jgi:alpha-amylase